MAFTPVGCPSASGSPLNSASNTRKNVGRSSIRLSKQASKASQTAAFEDRSTSVRGLLRNTYALAVNGHTGLPQRPPKINHARREAQGESSATNHVAT